MALGMDAEEILSTFYTHSIYARDGDGWRIPFQPETLKGQKATTDMIDADSGEVVVEAGKKLTPRLLKQLTEKGVKFIKATDDDLVGSYLAEDIVNPETGEVYLEAGDELESVDEERRAQGQFGGSARGRLRRDQGSRHRSHQCRRLYSQHARSRQEHLPPGSAVRHLPCHASRRAADHGFGRSHVPVAVLRFRALRPVGRWPRQDEHASRPRRRGHRARTAQGRHPRCCPHAGIAA
jgi:hypothetical protein